MDVLTWDSFLFRTGVLKISFTAIEELELGPAMSKSMSPTAWNYSRTTGYCREVVRDMLIYQNTCLLLGGGVVIIQERLGMEREREREIQIDFQSFVWLESSQSTPAFKH